MPLPSTFTDKLHNAVRLSLMGARKIEELCCTRPGSSRSDIYLSLPRTTPCLPQMQDWIQDKLLYAAFGHELDDFYGSSETPKKAEASSNHKDAKLCPPQSICKLARSAIHDLLRATPGARSFDKDEVRRAIRTSLGLPAPPVPWSFDDDVHNPYACLRHQHVTGPIPNQARPSAASPYKACATRKPVQQALESSTVPVPATHPRSSPATVAVVPGASAKGVVLPSPTMGPSAVPPTRRPLAPVTIGNLGAMLALSKTLSLDDLDTPLIARLSVNKFVTLMGAMKAVRAQLPRIWKLHFTSTVRASPTATRLVQAALDGILARMLTVIEWRTGGEFPLGECGELMPALREIVAEPRDIVPTGAPLRVLAGVLRLVLVRGSDDFKPAFCDIAHTFPALQSLSLAMPVAAALDGVASVSLPRLMTLVLDQTSGIEKWQPSRTSTTLQLFHPAGLSQVVIISPCSDMLVLAASHYLVGDEDAAGFVFLTLNGVRRAVLHSLRGAFHRWIVENISPVYLKSFTYSRHFSQLTHLVISLWMHDDDMRALFSTSPTNLSELDILVNAEDTGTVNILRDKVGMWTCTLLVVVRFVMGLPKSAVCSELGDIAPSAATPTPLCMTDTVRFAEYHHLPKGTVRIEVDDKLAVVEEWSDVVEMFGSRVKRVRFH